MSVHLINSDWLTISKVKEIVNSGVKLELSAESKSKIEKCRAYLDNKMATNKEPIYGINTGFGSLCNTQISNEDLSTLQSNLVKSHACGVGEEVPSEIVRLMIFLKIQGLSYGHSGVALTTVERLITFYNEDVLPVVYQQGSLGASGDLAPLANMSLALLGLGEVNHKGERKTAESVLNEMELKPLTLQSKEGLALLNGTQFMSSYAVWCLNKAHKLSDLADLIGTVSLEGFDGRKSPFTPQVHEVRGHKGQIQTAANIRKYLKGSELIDQEKVHVQDPYSFRCMPQVHGASKDAIDYATSVVEREINSVTDNPTIFPDEDLIVSAGNFHGQPLALALDNLAIALAELGSISERRTYKLIGGIRNLPAFLVADPGLNSGFMIPQYAQASVVSQNKQLCTPASVDTIDSSNGQEDHVSMGANAATKTYRVVQNLEKILGIELFNGTQALEFRRPLKSSKIVEDFVTLFRKEVSFVEQDKVMSVEMDKAIQFVGNYEF